MIIQQLIPNANMVRMARYLRYHNDAKSVYVFGNRVKLVYASLVSVPNDMRRYATVYSNRIVVEITIID